MHGLIGPYVDQHYALRQYDVQAAAIGNAATLSDMLPCWSLITEAHVNYQGKMSACFYDHDPKFHMGDLSRGSLLDVWHSDRFAELRRKHLARDVSTSPCADCLGYSHV